MRIHFWALRECKLDQHEPFMNWYIQFIEHFIAVYEGKAPVYAVEDAAWSADQKNLSRYERQDRKMLDIIPANEL